MKYFVIYNGDGDTTVSQLSKEELVSRITPDEDGEGYYGKVGFLKSIEEKDTNYWGDNILIIKGEIVIPEPKNVIKSFDIG